MFVSGEGGLRFKSLNGQIQWWSPQGHLWPQGYPRGHIFQSLVLSLASKPTSFQKYPVLDARTALFFDWLQRKNQTIDNISDSLSIRCFFSEFEKIIQCDSQLSQVILKIILNGIV